MQNKASLILKRLTNYRRFSTGGLAIWRGDKYIISFLFALVSLDRIAVKLNPKIRGLNYYSRFDPRVAGNVFLCLNRLIRRWIGEKYRLKSKKAIVNKYESYVQLNTGLFVHWQKEIKY